MDMLVKNLQSRFGNKLVSCDVASHGEVTIVVHRDDIVEVCRALRDEKEFDFKQLIDLCGVDYYSYGDTEWQTEVATETGFSRGREKGKDERHTWKGDRFAVVYHLLSLNNNQRVRVRAFVDEEMPIIASVIDVWSIANWFEREAFDMYGIVFEGHPDLRRLLTDYGFIGHPFRKDFPLYGHVEMRYDEDKQRVVYEPVQIEERVLVPKVIRDDHRYVEHENNEETEQ
jgi:NADH-quinone oxidoreductase subunit C